MGDDSSSRRRERGGSFSMGIGGASILVVFVILALVALATLSLASAGAEKRLSDQAMTVLVDYYAADSYGERLLAKLDEELERLWDQNQGESQEEQGYRQSLLEQLPMLEDAQVSLTVEEEEEKLLIGWTLQIDDRRTLEILVDASSRLQSREGDLQRLCWKLVVAPIEGEEDGMQIIGS